MITALCLGVGVVYVLAFALCRAAARGDAQLAHLDDAPAAGSPGTP